MSTLYIRHPARACVEAASTLPPCTFALVADNGRVEREGNAPLASLASTVADASRVVLVLAASDVCLWRVKLPPLSAAKLRLALPNLIEEQLLTNPSDCIVLAAPGPADADGMHCIAVAQRAWLESLQQGLRDMGARKISAYPAQLCVDPTTLGAGALAVVEHSQDSQGADITICRADVPGLGLPLWVSQPQALAQEVMQTLRNLVPSQQSLQLFVSEPQLANYQALASGVENIEVLADNWPRWISGAQQCKLDLMQAVVGGSNGAFDMGRWRWPAVLLILLALLHIVSLNVEWLRAKREADMLNKSMVKTFMMAYPKEPLSSDLVAQLKSKINAAKLNSGQAAPDDFTAISAAFGEAWTAVSQNRKVAEIAALDYKDRSLSVVWKDEGELPQEEMVAALAARHLSLAATAPRTWQIKLKK